MSESSRLNSTVAEENTAGEPTPFDNVDVEEDVGRDGEAPSGETLTDEENAEIEKQVAEIVTAGGGRAADEEAFVDPMEVS
ncbi:MAG TPA: hypothetical protein VFR35_08085 [Actinoplanes sp.]|nr:hypothetical protein [Actinoplanes sp.]